MAAINDPPPSASPGCRPPQVLIEQHAIGSQHRARHRRGRHPAQDPHIRLIDDGNLVQLGCGAKQRRIWTAGNRPHQRDREGISNKGADQDLPVPAFRPRRPGSRQCRGGLGGRAGVIGLPVVVNRPTPTAVAALCSTCTRASRSWPPTDRGQGSSLRHGRAHMVEGEEHRLLIVGGGWSPPLWRAVPHHGRPTAGPASRSWSRAGSTPDPRRGAQGISAQPGAAAGQPQGHARAAAQGPDARIGAGPAARSCSSATACSARTSPTRSIPPPPSSPHWPRASSARHRGHVDVVASDISRPLEAPGRLPSSRSMPALAC